MIGTQAFEGKTFLLKNAFWDMPTQPPSLLKNPCVGYAKVRVSKVWESKRDWLNHKNGNIACGQARIF